MAAPVPPICQLCIIWLGRSFDMMSQIQLKAPSIGACVKALPTLAVSFIINQFKQGFATAAAFLA